MTVFASSLSVGFSLMSLKAALLFLLAGWQFSILAITSARASTSQLNVTAPSHSLTYNDQSQDQSLGNSLGTQPLMSEQTLPNVDLGDYKTFGVIGDSISAGAVANPVLTLDPDRVWAILLGHFEIDYAVSRVTVLPNSMREYNQPLSWAALNLVNAASALYFNDEDKSWPAKLASRLGVEHKNILVAAKNGERAESAVMQVERILEYTRGIAPDVVTLLFTGNDLCSAIKPLITTADNYKFSIENALDYLFRNARPRISNGLVILPAVLNLTQLVKDEKILNKKISIFGGERTCKQLRESKYRATQTYTPKYPQALSFAAFFPPTPAAFCPSLFDVNVATQEYLSYIATTSKSYRQVIKSTAAKYNALLKEDSFPGYKGWRVIYSESPADLLFSSDEIANDCFHLSDKGQSSLQNAILEDLEKTFN